jgi:ParB family chromosome partitioning protein
MIEEFGVSQGEVGELVGRDRSTVANALRLLRLPQTVQDLVHGGKLSTGHARALLQVNDQRTVPVLAERMVTDQLSVREAEALTRSKKPGKRRPRYTRNDSPQDAQIRRVEDALRTKLGTDVFVAMRGKGSGRVTINFYSNDDLARILELMLGEPFDG